jgi:diamine N-acetyltransferase
MIELRPVTQDNRDTLINLKVREDQKNFVASNLDSIAESQIGFDEEGQGHWNLTPYGMYAEGMPVGFAMIGMNYQHTVFQGLILRLMVDEKFQGKGYGRAAMESMIAGFKTDEAVKTVCLSYEPHNKMARTLYTSLGFVETGEMLEGETVALLKIRP